MPVYRGSNYDSRLRPEELLIEHTSFLISFSLTSPSSCFAVSCEVSNLAQVKDNFSDFSLKAVDSRFKPAQFDSNSLYLSFACSNYTKIHTQSIARTFILRKHNLYINTTYKLLIRPDACLCDPPPLT